jgi:two-component system chemotaxis response regulator CheB
MPGRWSSSHLAGYFDLLSISQFPAKHMNIRILVVDDAAIFRRGISQALADVPGVEVVGTAANGQLALSRIAELRPDLVTLDVEMPDMDGISVLREISARKLGCAVIILSSASERVRDLTVKALEAGAFDFVSKPESHSAIESISGLRERLLPPINIFKRQFEIRSPHSPKQPPRISVRETAPAATSGDREPSRLQCRPGPRLVLIAVSTGGPAALAEVLPALPANLGTSVFIVQHMPPLFTQSLAKSLDGKCSLRVKEASNGEIAAPNTVYLAPGGKHMKIAAGAKGEILVRITDDPPENNLKPAADMLFRSAASHFPGQSLAVILTGMGNDGTLGLRVLKQTGCFAIAQDESTSTVFGMPKEAIQTGCVDQVLPLDRIAPAIVSGVRERVKC